MSAAEKARLFEDMMAFREDVFRICLGFSRNPTEAEDLSQEVYLKAVRSLPRIRRPYAIKDWLFKVARTTCLDHQKRTRVARLFMRRPGGPDEWRERVTPEASAVVTEALGSLKRAVGRLPRRQREVFVLREYGHLSYEELARQLGIKVGTVMSRLNRARRAVTAMMKEEGHGPHAE